MLYNIRKDDLYGLYNLLLILSVLIVFLEVTLFFGYDRIQTGQFYILTLGVSLFFSVLAMMSNITKRLFIISALFIPFCLLGFREFSGIDDPVYLSIFEHIRKESVVKYFFSSTMEPGYLFLNKVVSLFTSKYIYMQIIATFIPFLFLYKSFIRYERHANIFIILLFLNSFIFFQILAAGLVRMFIAIAIIIYAFSLIYSKELKKYVFLVLVASLFHYSALLMLVFTYFFFPKVESIRVWKKFTFISTLIMPFIILVVIYIASHFLGERYLRYTQILNENISISTFDAIPFIIIALVFKKNIPKNEQNSYYFFIAMAFFSLIVSIGSTVIPLGRLVFYLRMSYIMIFATIYKNTSIGLVKYLLFLFCLVFSFWYLFHSQWNFEFHVDYLFPYKNIYFSN